MEEPIFRKQNIDRIKSPDNLNTYIKIADPGIWLGLIAILAFAVGMLFWCIFAKLETRENSAVIVTNGAAKCYLDENMQRYVSDSMTIEIEGQIYALGDHGKEMEKLAIGQEDDEALLYLMDKENSGWYYIYEISASNLQDGMYKGVVVIDSVNPISFMINKK